MLDDDERALLYDFLRDDWTVFLAWAATRGDCDAQHCQRLLVHLLEDDSASAGVAGPWQP